MTTLQLGEIGARIAEYRKRYRIKQYALAERVGLHPVTLSRIEHGQLPGLTLAVLWRIAADLKVPVAYLWEQVLDRPAHPWEQGEETRTVYRYCDGERASGMYVPQRIQCSRKPPWKTPTSVYVGRPKRTAKDWPAWGNPYIVGEHAATAEACVALFTQRYAQDADYRARVRLELTGKDLACWCPLGAFCHGEVLLMWANTPTCE